MEKMIIVPPAAEGLRLDQALTAQVPELTRSQAQRLLRLGRILLAGQMARPAQRVAAGQQISLNLPSAEPMELQPTPLDLHILYEDQHLIVINKAAGVVVHPAPGHQQDTLVHGLLHHCRDLAGIGGLLRPGIVHRLDKYTSGALVAAKHDAAHQGLVREFAQGRVNKQYLALVWNHPRPQGRIDQPIGRHPVDRKRMSGHSRSSRPALSSWQVMEYYDGPLSLLKVHLHTGRTHQIRVHLSEAGFPLLGDTVYAPKKARQSIPGLAGPAPRQMLHAWQLEFIHPITAELVSLTAPLPEDMQSIIEQLKAQLCSRQL